MEISQVPLSHSGSQAKNAENASPLADVEKNEDGGTLHPDVSEPPYSIFSTKMKMWIIFLVSISALISPFGATTFYPALNVLAEKLDVSPAMVNISLTTYMIAQAIAPSIIAGMSDNSGRRLSFIVCFAIFIVANIGLALQTNYAALLVLRMVQATGSSASIALSVAVVADVATSAERGQYMGYATAGLLFGPAFGPTIGGVLAQYLGWRSIFWFLAIYAGVLLAMFTLLFPETCRNVVGNGSTLARGVNRSLVSYLQEQNFSGPPSPIDSNPPTATGKRGFNFPNPLGTLRILGEKESCIVLLYNGLFFTGMMTTTAAVPELFKSAYGLDELRVGLCYIALGTGSLISALTMGHVVDWNFRRHAKRLQMPIAKGKQQDLRHFPIELVRLQVVVPGHLIGTAALLMFGWSIKFNTHISLPEVALFFIGFGISTAFNITNTLLVDLHRNQPATATAAVNFVRCLMSAGGSAAIIPMCQAMNAGWAFTLIALIYVILVAAVFWIMRKGMAWREAEAKKLLGDDKRGELDSRNGHSKNVLVEAERPINETRYGSGETAKK
ncbi:MFS general substrate transporter [Lindgomyces ingoldianus]|uniref:MFS general substrate transporter n=1 Tax=Lindgomyces ingoldianus TaxID=673940 RepID=A0ACB6QE42_9PLEO|nr:MFS general substrate transporter [Lindgomyces ingoldianus]KAF2464392.1 MFS general substrate transporter [Lindgomyces ingoldianus]